MACCPHRQHVHHEIGRTPHPIGGDVKTIGGNEHQVWLHDERALTIEDDIDRRLHDAPELIAADRLHICTDRVWGPPDLVVEVLSMGTARHDSTVKLSWFQRYGVRECWLIDPVAREVHVVSFSESTRSTHAYTEHETVESSVLPQLHLRVADLFRL